MAPEYLFILLLIVLIAFIVCAFLAWYFTYNAKIKERLLLIEKGLNPDEFLKKTDTPGSSPWLKAGIVVIGLSVGLRVAARFVGLDAYQLPVMGIFAGVSFIAAHYIDRKNKNR